jgi:hypothetical protein
MKCHIPSATTLRHQLLLITSLAHNKPSSASFLLTATAAGKQKI